MADIKLNSDTEKWQLFSHLCYNYHRDNVFETSKQNLPFMKLMFTRLYIHVAVLSIRYLSIRYWKHLRYYSINQNQYYVDFSTIL